MRIKVSNLIINPSHFLLLASCKKFKLSNGSSGTGKDDGDSWETKKLC